jgi:hypothetical protein
MLTARAGAAVLAGVLIVLGFLASVLANVLQDPPRPDASWWRKRLAKLADPPTPSQVTWRRRRTVGFCVMVVGILAGAAAFVLPGGTELPPTTTSTSTSYTPSTTTRATTTAPSTVPTSGPGATLVFDDLGGGDPTIQVYPSPDDSAAGRISNGTFRHGQRVTAQCRRSGRTVNSDPSDGEMARSSDQWIRINGSPGQVQYATAVYVTDPDALVTSLPAC